MPPAQSTHNARALGGVAKRQLPHAWQHLSEVSRARHIAAKTILCGKKMDSKPFRAQQSTRRKRPCSEEERVVHSESAEGECRVRVQSESAE